MSTLSQIREGLSRAWDSITEGWRELREMAAEALTRFHPGSNEDALPQRRTVRWGLLAADSSAQCSFRSRWTRNTPGPATTPAF